ncbi:MAG: folate-binding protein YgfZ [Chthoniobacterales bacterium]
MTVDVRPEEGAVFDLTDRAKLRVTGADRLRYLNGQISNDLRKTTAQTAIHACVLTAKGKIDADVFIVAHGESFLVDVDAGIGEQLQARLDRYVIADDVTVADVTDEWALLHLTGANVPAVEDTVITARSSRFGCVGTDIWLPRASYETALRAIAAELSMCDAEAAELFRIEQGIPRWGWELSGEIIPNEAGLETAAIDYAKGCYIGQEVISRIKMSGQTNKRLCGLVAGDGGTFAEGMQLFAPDGREVGRLTSAAHSNRVGRQIGLGFLKRGYNDVGQQLEARLPEGDVSTRVMIVDLPFARMH